MACHPMTAMPGASGRSSPNHPARATAGSPASSASRPTRPQGGAVRRDLFASPEDAASVYLDNPVLLQTLAMEKLRSLAEEVRAEGWGWVDCLSEGDGLALRAATGAKCSASGSRRPRKRRPSRRCRRSGKRFAEALRPAWKRRATPTPRTTRPRSSDLSGALDEVDERTRCRACRRCAHGRQSRWPAAASCCASITPVA